MLWYFDQYPLKNVLHSLCICLEEETVDYLSAPLHTNTCTHTHMYNRWGPGGVFQAEGSQGPPGDKAERNAEDNMEEQGFFSCTNIHSVPAGLMLILLNTFYQTTKISVWTELKTKS